MPELEVPYQVGRWLVEPTAGAISAGGETRQVPPRLMRLLSLLAQHAGETVGRDFLVDALWPRGYVNEEALSRAVNELRSLLGDEARSPEYVLTVPKQGYRLIAPVSQPSTANKSPVRRLATVAAIAVLMLLAGFLLWPRSDAPEPLDVLPLDVLPLAERLTSDPGLEWQPEIAPDGKWLAQVIAHEGIGAIQLISTTTPEQRREIVHPDGLYSPVFSPDGARLATLSGQGEDCRVLIWPVVGGTGDADAGEFLVDCYRRDLLPGLDWSDDGQWIAFTTLDPDSGAVVLARIRLSDGSIELLTRLPDPYRSDVRPRFAPGGDKLSFSRGTRGVRELWLLDLNAANAEPRQLTRDGQFTSGHDWWPRGDAIILDSDRSGHRALWRLDLDGEMSLLGARDAQLPSVANNGSILFQVAQYESNIWRLSARTGERDERPLIASTKYDSSPAWSPDGSEIAFSSNRTGDGGIWIASADGTRVRQVYEPEEGRAVGPSWLADGSALLATEYRPGQQRLVRIALNRREVVALATLGERPYAPSQSPDGRWYYYLGSGPSGDSQLWQMGVEDATTQEAIVEGPLNSYQAADDGYLYFTRYARPGLWRLQASGGDAAIVIADFPAWAGQDFMVHDGWVYHADSDGLYRFELASGVSERISEIVPGGLGPSIAVHPDGDVILVATTDRAESDLFLASPK